MTKELVIGTILMDDRPAVSQALELEKETFSRGWDVLYTVGAPTLELKLGAVGWSCFFLAGEMKVTMFGSRAPNNSRWAVRRLLSKATAANFNCFEITRIDEGRFLGISYTTIGGHSRHIQQGGVLKKAEERRKQQADADWARG